VQWEFGFDDAILHNGEALRRGDFPRLTTTLSLSSTLNMAVLSLPLSFSNSFWTQDYRTGLEVIYDKLEQVLASHTYRRRCSQ
jgi:hypothetical protein